MITRHFDPDITLSLIPWYVTDDEKDCLQIGMELNDMMIQNPYDTLVLTVDEDNERKAMLVAYVKEDKVHIWQAHKMKGFRDSKKVLNVVEAWAKHKNLSAIQLATSDGRRRRLYKRKYGFKPVGGIYMEKQV